MMRINAISALLLLVAAVGCQDDGTSRVTFDLEPLYQHAAQTQMPIDELELLVTAEGLDYAPVSIDRTALTFDIVVPSGPARRFEIEAWMNEPGMVDRFTNYWGFETIDLVAGSTVDLIVPVTPAGRLIGTVTLDDGTSVPQSVDLVFTPSQSTPNMPAPMTVVATNGAFSVPMPAGNWMVAAEVTIGSTTYSTQADASVDIMWGEALPWPFVLFSDAAPVLTTVSVVNSLGVPQANMDILVHDSTGDNVIFEITTDLFGQATIDVVAGDMVTLIDITEAPNQYRLYTAAGVQPGDSIAFSVTAFAVNANPLATLLVDMTNPPPGLGSATVTAGCASPQLTAVASASVEIFDDCVGADGNADLLGIAIDGNSFLLGYAMTVDVALIDGPATVDFTNYVPDTFSVEVTSTLPLTGDIGVYLYPKRQGVNYTINQWGTVLAASPRPVLLNVPTNFFDYVDIELSWFVSGTEQKLRRRIREATRPGTIRVDFVGDVLPSVTTDPVNATDRTRPTVLWTTTALPADYDVAMILLDVYSKTGGGSLFWRIMLPPATTTSWRAPTIPITLPPEFQLDSYLDLPMAMVGISDFELHTGYREFLNQVGPKILDDQSPDEGPDQEFQNRSSGASMSAGG